MAKFSLDGNEVDAAPGAPLVEVIKQNGIFISNLCYIDGLAPYAGCRTCLVEIEGARGLQLACTSRVTEGMVVRTNTAQVLDARQSVLSIINANHSDRCLTCHRRVHCMPGDICLRDDTVTHRCLTCAKNYRCELQTTNEMLEMANVEPWLGEERTYYESEQPDADRANPFLEFDPQMCIICTRCVRACDEIRHTGAVTLAGRGFSTRIAFGAGGAIHDSNCDFCGACIDVCPTATLLEKPNKWIAKTETWVSSACNGCSVGCTLSMGVRNGKVVMVKPERLNPVSWDQICVRGRFHYDAVKPRERLTRHIVRQGTAPVASPFEAAIKAAARGLADVIKAHGPQSVGVLVAPWATNEEAYFAQSLSRSVIGTENIDSTAGPIAAAVSSALTGAFGSDRLASDLSTLATASTVVVVADDLESSHNIAALRVKDAVVKAGARLVVVASRYGEVCDFIAPPPSGSIMPSAQRVHSADPTGVWLRPTPGGELATVVALAEALKGTPSTEAPGIPDDALSHAANVIKNTPENGRLVVIYAPNPASAALTAEMTKAVANLTIGAVGSRAAETLIVLPLESNVIGIRDMGVVPGAGGAGLDAMMSGKMRALLIVGDNPMMHARDKQQAFDALSKLDFLVTIDSLPTETAHLAHVAFADLPPFGKDGTHTTADRRIVRLTRAETPAGDQRDSLEVLSALGSELALSLSKREILPAPDAEAIMNEIAATVPGYAGAVYRSLESGTTRAIVPGNATANVQPVELPKLPTDASLLLLTTSRTLFTSLEGASIRSPEADKMHREEFIELNPYDAAAMGIGQNRPVIVTRGTRTLELSAALTDAVAQGSAFLPLYYDGGTVNTLLDGKDPMPLVTIRPA